VCGITGADGKEYAQAQNTRHGANLRACFADIVFLWLPFSFFGHKCDVRVIFPFSAQST
jgi:hypothetical protein